MKKGSLVKYIGGQCSEGKQIFPLDSNTIYTSATDVFQSPFLGNLKPAIQLEEAGSRIAFVAKMFKEIQPPMDISEILKESLDLQEV